MSLIFNKTLNEKKEKEIFFNDETEIKKFLCALKILKILINTKILLLNIIKTKNNNKNILKLLNIIILKNLIKLFKIKLIKKKEIYSTILYIIRIKILQKNTIIQITNVKGEIKFSCSASSSLKLNGKKKIFQPKVLITLFKYFLDKIHFFFKNKKKIFIALQIKSIKKSLLKLIIKNIKKKINNIKIKIINSFNFFPHNGCRPKKIRKIKKNKKNKKKLLKKSLILHKTKKSKYIWKYLIQEPHHNDIL